MQNSCKNAQNTNVRNGRKKKQIINNCAQFKCSSVKGNIKKSTTRKKKEIKTTKNPQNEEMPRTRTCKYQESDKLEQFAKKNNQAGHKRIAKNKASKRLHI